MSNSKLFTTFSEIESLKKSLELSINHTVYKINKSNHTKHKTTKDYLNIIIDSLENDFILMVKNGDVNFNFNDDVEIEKIFGPNLIIKIKENNEILKIANPQKNKLSSYYFRDIISEWENWKINEMRDRKINEIINDDSDDFFLDFN
jgi:hypothetical protein